MDIRKMHQEHIDKGYGNLGNSEHGLQKVANDKAKADVLKEFSAEMDTHDMKRMPTGGSPLNSLRPAPMPKEEKYESILPLDFDERLNKIWRD